MIILIICETCIVLHGTNASRGPLSSFLQHESFFFPNAAKQVAYCIKRTSRGREEITNVTGRTPKTERTQKTQKTQNTNSTADHRDLVASSLHTVLAHDWLLCGRSFCFKKKKLCQKPSPFLFSLFLVSSFLSTNYLASCVSRMLSIRDRVGFWPRHMFPNPFANHFPIEMRCPRPWRGFLCCLFRDIRVPFPFSPLPFPLQHSGKQGKINYHSVIPLVV